MDQQLEELSSTIITNANRFFLEEGKKRYLIGISGRPGSGKTTLAGKLCVLINRHYQQLPLQVGKTIPTTHEAQPETSVSVNQVPLVEQTKSADHQNYPISMVISLDGWHYPRSVLDQFQDPREAHRRRGSPETFDAPAYRAFLERLLSEPEGEIKAPSFSHTTKDPIDDALSIYPTHRIIILEGLYTLLQVGPDWSAASNLIHAPIQIHVQPERAKQRLIHRHVLSGISADPILAAQRVDSNDHPNGEYLLKHSRQPMLVITSIEDPAMKISDEVP